MLVSDFMAKSRLKILNGISVTSMECLNVYEERKKESKNDTFCTLWVGTIKLLLAPNRSTSSTSFMDSVVIL